MRISTSLKPLLEAKSLCIIGASDDPGKIGGLPIALLRKYNYAGKVFPINPKYSVAFGFSCYPGLESLPEAPDLAVIALSADKVISTLQSCHDIGIKAAIVYAAGFAEASDAGRTLQQALTNFARQSQMLIAGPNCMGITNLNIQLHTAFASVFNTSTMQTGEGHTAIVTQSGNVCSALYGLLRQLDISVSMFINTGNEACLDFSDYLNYLCDDPHTHVILGYVEQLRDGPRFIELSKLLRKKDKLLILLKSGNTKKGASAVQSHTSALAGDRRIYSAIFHKYGIIEATDFRQMALIAQLAPLRNRAKGMRLAIVTISGALSAILADQFIAHGMQIPDLPESTQKLFKTLIPEYGTIGNPVDVTGNVMNHPEIMGQILSQLAISDAIDAVVVYAPGYMLDRMADPLCRTMREYQRFFAVIDTGLSKSREALRAAGVAVFTDVQEAVNALCPFLKWGAWRADPAHEVSRANISNDSGANLRPLGKPLNEVTTLNYLGQFGIPVKTKFIVHNAAEATRAAVSIGYPVVLKIVSPDIQHKTEVGGVKLNVVDDQSVERAFDEIIRNTNAKVPNALISGVLVQPYEAHGVELIVGAKRDKVFGPVLVIGTGGVMAELLNDTSIIPIPCSCAEIRAGLQSLRLFPLLNGFRGAEPCDVSAAVQAIYKVSRAYLHCAELISDLEINPLLVRPKDQGVAALDALAIPISS